MCTYVHAYLLDDSVSVRGPKAFLKVLALGDLPFRDVDEDIGDLEDVIEVCLYAIAVLLDLVLVARDLLYTQPPYSMVPLRGLVRTSKRFPAFLSRTIETFVSL